jgi:large subunit ribosomal protein L29
MKTSDLRAKDAAGLEKEVSELLKAHFGLRMQKATQQLTNHSQLKNTRRDIARAKTIQAEQKRAAGRGRARRGRRRPEPRNERRRDHPRRDRPPPAEPRAKNTRTLIGKVVSDKRSKTVTVLIERPHQARALRQDRRQEQQVPRARRSRRVQEWRRRSRSPRAGRSRRPSRGS